MCERVEGIDTNIEKPLILYATNSIGKHIVILQDEPLMRMYVEYI